MSKGVLKLFVDVRPGDVYESSSGLDGESCHFLKLAEEKSVNLTTWIVIQSRYSRGSAEKVLVVGTLMLKSLWPQVKL